MTEHDLHSIRGLILAVQEERFRLLSQDGQGYLLTLAKHASTGLRELDYWRESGALVKVEYSGQPNLDTGVAWSIRPA